MNAPATPEWRRTQRERGFRPVCRIFIELAPRGSGWRQTIYAVPARRPGLMASGPRARCPPLDREAAPGASRFDQEPAWGTGRLHAAGGLVVGGPPPGAAGPFYRHGYAGRRRREWACAVSWRRFPPARRLVVANARHRH